MVSLSEKTDDSDTALHIAAGNIRGAEVLKSLSTLISSDDFHSLMHIENKQ